MKKSGVIVLGVALLLVACDRSGLSRKFRKPAKHAVEVLDQADQTSGVANMTAADQAVAEAARVLRDGGRFAFSITHPTRWMFPDDPSEAGLVASQSYWDRTPYVEVDDETGEVSYVEHHRTLGDWVALLAGHGFVITDLREPEWPENHDRVWGGWSAVRGRFTPGTAIFGARLA